MGYRCSVTELKVYNAVDSGRDKCFYINDFYVPLLFIFIWKFTFTALLADEHDFEV